MDDLAYRDASSMPQSIAHFTTTCRGMRCESAMGSEQPNLARTLCESDVTLELHDLA